MLAFTQASTSARRNVFAAFLAAIFGGIVLPLVPAAHAAPDDLNREMREALWFSPDQTWAEGRWFWGEYQEFGPGVTAKTIVSNTPGEIVVQVVRDADRLSFAEVEKTIADFGRRARDAKLTIEELSGGTFTISNGGIYGSLMSTPILNPPQSGILGMHKIERRPVALGEKIAIRPMMYVALSYDHRIVDGREAVTFLVRIKECVEDPSRILFEM